MSRAAVTSAKLVAVVANGPAASGLAWPVTDHSQNWARAAFGISGRSPTKKAGSAHIVGCPSAIALSPLLFCVGVSGQTDEATMETVTDFIFLGSKNHYGW